MAARYGAIVLASASPVGHLRRHVCDHARDWRRVCEPAKRQWEL